jgi:hypothetical protein
VAMPESGRVCEKAAADTSCRHQNPWNYQDCNVLNNDQVACSEGPVCIKASSYQLMKRMVDPRYEPKCKKITMQRDSR